MSTSVGGTNCDAEGWVGRNIRELVSFLLSGAIPELWIDSGL